MMPHPELTPEQLEKHINECTIDDCDVCYEYFEGDFEYPDDEKESE